MTRKDPRTCVVQLGRFGDLISILPILRHIHENHGTPVVMVSRQFASLLEGVSYATPWVVDLDNSELRKAEALARQTYEHVIVSQIWGHDYQHPDKGTSFNRDSWIRAGFGYLFDRDDMLPVFDNRNLTIECEVMSKFCPSIPGEPYVVAQVTQSASSPWAKRGNHVLAMLEEECGKRGIRLVNIAGYQAPRIFDLLWLLGNARMICTIDTAILHLSTALPDVPCLTITNSSPWFGSEPRGRAWVPADYDNTVEEIREIAVQMLDAPVRDITWTPPSLDQKAGDPPPFPFILHVYNAHKIDGDERKDDAYGSWFSGVPWVLRQNIQPDRNARDEIGDKRELPYLKDVLSKGTWFMGKPNDILLWTNDDVHLHPDIYDLLRWHVSVHGACSARRVDFRGKVPAPVAGKPWRSDLPTHMGRDLLAFRRDWLEANWDLIPDFILGASDFDLCMAAFIRASHWIRTDYGNLHDDLHPSELPTGYVAHVVHPSVWSQPDNQDTAPSQLHNRRLFREWSEKSDAGLKFTRGTNVISV